MRPWKWAGGGSGPSRANPGQRGTCSEVGPASPERWPLRAALPLVSMFTVRADLRGPLCSQGQEGAVKHW